MKQNSTMGEFSCNVASTWATEKPRERSDTSMALEVFWIFARGTVLLHFSVHLSLVTGIQGQDLVCNDLVEGKNSPVNVCCQHSQHLEDECFCPQTQVKQSQKCEWIWKHPLYQLMQNLAYYAFLVGHTLYTRNEKSCLKQLLNSLWLLHHI